MNRYKVSFWFNGNKDDKKPSMTVTVETAFTEKRAIIRQALSTLKEYPRIYEVLVEKVPSNELFIIRIKDTEGMTKAQAWYANRNGEIMVVKLGGDGRYITAHTLDSGASVGIIEDSYFDILTTFDLKSQDKLIL